MKFALETVNVTRAVKYFRFVAYEFGVNYNSMWRKERKRKERKGREIRRNVCSNRRVKQAIQSNKEYDIAKGESDTKYIYIYIYTGCPGRNVPDFGRMFLKLKYTDITKNTYIRS